MRPLINGTIVGLILGDPVKGMIVGATINLVYMGVVGVGTQLPANLGMAGTVGTIAAIIGGLTPEESLAVAIPVGIASIYLGTFRKTLFTGLVQYADRLAEEGNLKGIVLLQAVPSMITSIFTGQLPLFLVTIYGGNAVKGFIDAMPKQALDGLNTAGALLPAVGIGMLLTYMGRTRLLPFFFIGYLLAAYGSTDLMLAGLLGILVALVYVQLMRVEKEEDLV